MTAIPHKLYEAFEKIRLGKVEEGTRMFDRVEGCDDIKSIALAELSYFRHDWKRGMSFVRDFLESEEAWETIRKVRSCTLLHFTLFVLCTCHLDSWKESRAYLRQLKKQYDNFAWYHQAISLISDPENTKRRLLESRPELKKEGKISLEELERDVVVYKLKGSTKYWRHISFDRVVYTAYRDASTEDHITTYERFCERLEDTETHQTAAKSYIAVGNMSGAREAIRRYMRCWKFEEPYQVAPIVLFTDHELWAVLSDRRFTESLLTIPHHRES